MKPYSDFPTTPALLAARAAALGDAVAVTFESGRPCSFHELDDRAGRVHAWLHAHGVRPGDRVAVLMDNSLEFLHAFLGIARAGAVSVPVNTSMIGDALEHALVHSGSVGLFVDARLRANVAATSSAAKLRWQVVHGDDDPQDAVSFAEVLASDVAPPAVPDLTAGSPMTIVYTSGTTGLPKGVVLPHQSYTNTGGYFAHHLRLGAEDRLHTCLPLFHCNAQQCSFMVALHLGVPLALNAKFSVSRFWSWIDGSRPTVTNLLGAMLTLLDKAPERPEDPANSLRYIAAAPIPEHLHRRFEERFGLQLVEGYGLTETGTMACINPVDDRRVGTIGLPLEHNELRIVDEHGEDLADEEPGEILVRSHVEHAMMLEYFDEPEKTAEALAGGWFHTGDMGRRRADGYHVFLDRMKDSIRRRGENISSFLVEKGVLDHPSVLQAAAYGVPSEFSEDDVMVAVVPKEGHELDPADVVAWCGERMAAFMVPRYVSIRDALPTTETGRVQKVVLRAEGTAGAYDAQPTTVRTGS